MILWENQDNPSERRNILGKFIRKQSLHINNSQKNPSVTNTTITIRVTARSPSLTIVIGKVIPIDPVKTKNLQ